MKMRITSLSLLTIVLPGAGGCSSHGRSTLYSNGAYKLAPRMAWTINFGFSVSDSFTVPSGSEHPMACSLVYWDSFGFRSSDHRGHVRSAATSFGGSSSDLDWRHQHLPGN